MRLPMANPSSLPKWITDIDPVLPVGHTSLRRALSIALEALKEHENDVHTEVDCFDFKRSFCKCKTAIRQIEALGEKE